jgi:hypothetical protein
VSFAAITLSVASQRVFIVVVVDFGIELVRKFLDTPSYVNLSRETGCLFTASSKAFSKVLSGKREPLQSAVRNLMSASRPTKLAHAFARS